MAPADYNEMLFQLKAFLALIEILFGDESITAGKLQAFVRLIESQSILGKGLIALGNFFQLKVLWTVCTWFQLILDSCTQVEDQEEADDSLIDWREDHRDILLDCFSATLPPCFKDVTNGNSDTEAKKGKKTGKHKKEEGKEKKKKE